MLDRAGLVGADGATHHGTFDLAYLGCVPDIVIMAPSDEFELQNMVETSYGIDNRPSVVRYPRGSGYGIKVVKDLFNIDVTVEEQAGRGTALPLGRGRVVKHHFPHDSRRKLKVALFSLGTRLAESVLAARQLEAQCSDVSVTVADARFMKPLDTQLIDILALENDVLLTIEEGSSVRTSVVLIWAYAVYSLFS